MSEARQRRLILLGATGSIGANTLDVVEALAAEHRFVVVGVAAGSNGKALRAIVDRFAIPAAAVADGSAAAALDGVPVVFSGRDAATRLVRAVARPGDLCVAAMVGACGIEPTVTAIESGCDIALANKETLVAAGEFVMPLARGRGVRIVPVDSEHSAIEQCVRAGRDLSEVRRVVLTASGGPFRTWTADRMGAATPEQALRHPTWSMGPKISVDSATMMNKALEVIEAHWLFGLEPGRIEVIVHPSSVVHSFVEFADGSVIAQLSPPDMRSPIQYALTSPRRIAGPARRLDFSTLARLEFEPVDHARFPAVGLAYRAIERGGTAGAVLNAANEAAVGAFLDGRLRFDGIVPIVREAMESIDPAPVTDLAAVARADAAARSFVLGRVNASGRESGRERASSPAAAR